MSKESGGKRSYIMRNNFTRHGSITQLAALSLLAFCLIQMPAGVVQSDKNNTTPQSNPSDGAVVILSSSIPLGMGRGQTIRFTLFNPPNSQREPLRVHVKLYDQRGNAIAESAEATIPADEFRSFD